MCLDNKNIIPLHLVSSKYASWWSQKLFLTTVNLDISRQIKECPCTLKMKAQLFLVISSPCCVFLKIVFNFHSNEWCDILPFTYFAHSCFYRPLFCCIGSRTEDRAQFGVKSGIGLMSQNLVFFWEKNISTKDQRTCFLPWSTTKKS